jgi:hypothetical protein
MTTATLKALLVTQRTGGNAGRRTEDRSNEYPSEPSDAYIEGFVAGAVEFFEQLRDQI